MRAGRLEGTDDGERAPTAARRSARRAARWSTQRATPWSALLATIALGAACGGEAQARGPTGGATPAPHTAAGTAPAAPAVTGAAGAMGAAGGEVVAGAPAAATSDPASATLVEEALASGDAELALDWRTAAPGVAPVMGDRRATSVATDRAGDAPRVVDAAGSRGGRADRARRAVPRALPRTVAIPALPDFGPPGRPTVPLDEPAARRSGLLDHWAEPAPAIPATPAKAAAPGGGALRRAARWLVGREASGGGRDTGATRATPQGTGEPGPARPRQPVP